MANITARKENAALFLNEGKAGHAAAWLNLYGFIANVARETERSPCGGRDQGYRVLAFHADRSFAGFYAE